jgi:hypothetical protein
MLAIYGLRNRFIFAVSAMWRCTALMDVREVIGGVVISPYAGSRHTEFLV